MTAQRTTRRPTGRPSWPITLLAGVEGSGKSYKAAEATGSDLVGRSFWLSVGEDDPDEYGRVPGADFEIVNHDGTYRDQLAALEWASTQPQVDDKPTLLIVDSFGRVWDLLANMAQAEANRRRRDATGEARIASDLWNLAGARWERMLNVMRRHAGPVIITARLERQTVFTEAGDPTKEKHNKVKAQKGLASDAGVVVELREWYPSPAHVVKARSLTWQADPSRAIDGFTIDGLWRALGLAGETTERSHTEVKVAPGEHTADEARAELRAYCGQTGRDLAEVAAKYHATHGRDLKTEDDADPIRQTLAEIQQDDEHNAHPEAQQ